MNGNRIIVHALIKIDNKYLVIKRSENETTYPNYWDIPGGLQELSELPKDALIRETLEEVGLNIVPGPIIHEDSNYDKEKDMIFIRLVYISYTKESINNIKLDLNEHSEYKLINDLSELNGELISPFLLDVFNNDLKNKEGV